VLAERYRVVGLLGKGGMGEVFRADDLTLGQPVALKFLPAAVEGDAERLERFFSEVRIARKVTHPAVCRVYDIGEHAGQHFLSMEYVDGENLATLLRRIGRLGPDKAQDIARQLCAGLAAAHERGVLHRDLKPENVMLDGQGKVRVTDFGLAGLEDSIRGDDVRSGTPAYMSPEQLTGREVTARSDVYSLGLVLYELFTGRKAFEGKTFAELLSKHRDQRPPEPSSLVPNLDPAVERTILRCIEKDPGHRPASALGVMALLPGGDPLSAALAAGITPSPEMVAAAGEHEGLRPGPATLALGIVLAGVALAPAVVGSIQLVGRVPLDKPPAVLEDRGRALVQRLTGGDEPMDTALGFDLDEAYFGHVRATDPSPTRWDALGSGDPPVLGVWYRQSPHQLLPTTPMGTVSWDNPPLGQLAGNAGVRLDMRGRLLSFYSVPPQIEEPAGPLPPPDWSPLFAEADLDPRALTPVEPRWTPPFYAEARAAWEGTCPGRSDLKLRVEAASYRGKPAAFFLVNPWSRPERERPRDITRGQALAVSLTIAIVVSLLVAGAILARKNLQLGRGDRRGGARLAGYLCASGMVCWGLEADHVADRTGEVILAARGAAFVLLISAMLWLFYLALEPYVRRMRPQALISWNRFLSGGLHEPVVGRDVLLGTAWGVLFTFLLAVAIRVPGLVGQPPLAPTPSMFSLLLDLRRLAAGLVSMQMHAIILGTAALLIFVLFRLLLRRDLAAAIALALVLSVVQAAELEASLPVRLILGVVIMGGYSALLMRLGLLAAFVAVFVLHLIFNFPQTTHLSAWYAMPTVVSGLAVAILAVYGYRTATRTYRISAAA
jgi:serine/threonine-protein kinase